MIFIFAAEKNQWYRQSQSPSGQVRKQEVSRQTITTYFISLSFDMHRCICLRSGHTVSWEAAKILRPS